MSALDLQQLRQEAELLRKRVLSSDRHVFNHAARRLSVLHRFAGLGDSQVVAALKRQPLKLKEALLVVALEAGHASWAELKQAASTHTPESEFIRPERIPPAGAASPWAGNEFTASMVRGWGLGATSISFDQGSPTTWVEIEGWLLQGIDRIPRAWVRLDRLHGRLQVDWFDERGRGQFDVDALAAARQIPPPPEPTPEWAVLLTHVCSRSGGYHSRLQAALLEHERKAELGEDAGARKSEDINPSQREAPWAGPEPSIELSFAQAAQIACSLMDYRNAHLRPGDPDWADIVRLERVFSAVEERIKLLLVDPAAMHERFPLGPPNHGRRKPLLLTVEDCWVVADALATWRLRPAVLAIEENEVDGLAVRWLEFAHQVDAAGDFEFDLPLRPRNTRARRR